MLDITQNVLAPVASGQPDTLSEMLSWLKTCIGPMTKESVTDTGTMQYDGEGWELGCMRPVGEKKKYNTMTFYVRFDDDHNELMFKLIWSNLTSQITL